MELGKLWEIQQLEFKVEKLRRQLQDDEVEQKLSELEESISLIKEEENAKAEKLSKLQRKNKNREMLSDELRDKKKELSNKLYSGEVSNVKELNNIQEKFDQLKEELENTEENILSIMETMETGEEELSLLQEKLNQKKEEFKREKMTVEQWKEEMETEITEAELKAIELSKEIDTKLLENYRRERDKTKKAVVSKVVGENCGLCHVEQPMNLLLKAKKGEDLVKCENCGRILFVE